MISVCAIFLLSLALLTDLDAAITKPKMKDSLVDETERNEVPYMVGIFELSTYVMRSLCGGAILSNRVILSSANCVEKSMDELNKLVAILGSPKTAYDDEATKIKIDYVSLPPFKIPDSKMRKFDIALIRTTEEIIFTDVIQPVALPKADLYDEIVTAFVSGYGLVQQLVAGERNSPAKLQILRTSMMSHSQCLYKYYKIANDDMEKWNEMNEKITENNVCTSNMKNRGICIGDNGSPLVANNTVVGVASWTYGCAQGFPDVYTKTYPHLKWIEAEKKQIIHQSDA